MLTSEPATPALSNLSCRARSGLTSAFLLISGSGVASQLSYRRPKIHSISPSISPPIFLQFQFFWSGSPKGHGTAFIPPIAFYGTGYLEAVNQPPARECRWMWLTSPLLRRPPEGRK
jgi:hypothetical protein